MAHATENGMVQTGFRDSNEFIVGDSLPAEWGAEYAIADGAARRWTFVFSDRAPRAVDLKIRLAGRGSRGEVVVAYLGRGGNETDMTVTVSHQAPQTFGRITLRAALFDAARFVLRGMLELAPEAKGADSYLSAQGLLVSPKSRAEIYPYLEIRTDEVRASHGTSVGRIDERALFYLQSRGVGRSDAERIMLAGFFRGIAAELPTEYAVRFFQG